MLSLSQLLAGVTLPVAAGRLIRPLGEDTPDEADTIRCAECERLLPLDQYERVQHRRACGEIVWTLRSICRACRAAQRRAKRRGDGAAVPPNAGIQRASPASGEAPLE